MKITGIRTGILSVPLRTPFITALRRVDSIKDLIVEIETDSPHKGYGEAPPTAAITGDTLEGIRSAIRNHIAPALIGKEIEDFEAATMAVQRALVHNSSAKAAVDIALWDLLGKRYGLPVMRLLGGTPRTIETDLTISVNDPQVMARDTVNALERGFRCLKVKVGINPSLDVERLLAVREAAGKEVRIRIDANQAWKRKEAVRILDRMEEMGLDIELVEQPVRAEDLEGLKYVTDESPIPVLADESVFSPSDAMRILQMRAADMINIKLMKCGGITNALQILSMAQVSGAACMLGSMLEAKVSVNAAAHLAASRGIISCIDLDGPLLAAADPVKGGARFEGKNIILNDAPGFGIEGFEDEAIVWD